MKKILLSAAIPLVLLAGCGGGTESSESSATSTTAVSQSESSNSSTSESSRQSSETTTETSSATQQTQQTQIEQSSATAATTPQQQADTVLDSLKSAYPDSLPTRILTADSPEYVSAATTGTKDMDNYRILYYAEKEAIGVNDPQLDEKKPIAAFEKKTYATHGEAALAVNQIVDDGGKEVDLGHQITGHQQGAAGSSYISWREGNWMLAVQASNVEGEKPLPLAKDAVAYLEEASLPAPDQDGQINLVVTGSDYESNRVTWQEGRVVYTIQHQEAMAALKMAVSVQ